MKTLRFMMFVFVVSLSVVACASGGTAAPSETNPTIAPLPTAAQLLTVAPQPTLAMPTTAPESAMVTTVPPTAASSGLGQILFQDDFSDPNSGWMDADLSDIQFGYDAGVRRIIVKTANLNSHDLLPKKAFDNVSIEVDATFAAGQTNGIFGILCRATADTLLQKGYEFLITADGGYGIVKVTGPNAGESTLLGQEGKSDAILTGTATNHLRADCSGDNLALYVNGQKIDAVTDSELTTGQAGFELSTPANNTGYEVQFDNFVVRAANP